MADHFNEKNSKRESPKGNFRRFLYIVRKNIRLDDYDKFGLEKPDDSTKAPEQVYEYLKYYEIGIALLFPGLGIALLSLVQGVFFPTFSAIEFIAAANAYFAIPAVVIFFVIRPAAFLIAPEFTKSELWKSAIINAVVKDYQTANRVVVVLIMATAILYMTARVIDHRHTSFNRKLDEAIVFAYGGRYDESLAKLTVLRDVENSSNYQRGLIELADLAIEVDQGTLEERASYEYWNSKLTMLNSIKIYDSQYRRGINTFAGHPIFYNSDVELFHRNLLAARIYMQLEVIERKYELSKRFLTKASEHQTYAHHGNIVNLYLGSVELLYLGSSQEDERKSLARAGKSLSTAEKDYSGPLLWLIHNQLGEYKFKNNDLDGAIEEYRRAVIEAPISLQYYPMGNMATCFYRKENFIEAGSVLNTAISMSDIGFMNRIRLVISLTKSKMYEQAWLEALQTETRLGLAENEHGSLESSGEEVDLLNKRKFLRVIKAYIALKWETDPYRSKDSKLLTTGGLKALKTEKLLNVIRAVRVGSISDAEVDGYYPKINEIQKDDTKIAEEYFYVAQAMKQYPYIGLDAYAAEFYEAAIQLITFKESGKSSNEMYDSRADMLKRMINLEYDSPLLSGN